MYKIIIFYIFLVFLKSVFCLKYEEHYEKLYEKFRIESIENESELKILDRLHEINHRVCKFNQVIKKRGYVFDESSEINGTENIDFDESNPVNETLDKQFVATLVQSGLNFVTNSVQDVLNIFNVSNIFSNANTPGLPTGVRCLACNTLANILALRFVPRFVFDAVLNLLCIASLIGQGASQSSSYISGAGPFCSGAITRLSPHLIYIRDNTVLTPIEVCGAALGVQCYFISGTCFSNPFPLSQNLCWTVQLSQPPAFVAQPQINATLSVLQVSDIHLDRSYTQSSTRNCGYPYCCTPALADNIQTPRSGRFGSYLCDSPPVLVNDAFRSISNERSPFSYVYWTGDVSNHVVWQDTFGVTNADSQFISTLLTNLGIPIVFAIGNHIAIPVGTFAPPNNSIPANLSAAPYYNNLYNQLGGTLPTLTAPEVNRFRTSGYYQVQLANYNFQIIVLNTNYCDRLNFWTYFNTVDPAGQLQWLDSVLLQAQTNRQIVHIVAHIQPDDSTCTQAWVYNYLRIVERYQNIIGAQIFGHTHRDEFRLQYSINDTTCTNAPIGVEILGPSITPYDETLNFNPAYRVFSMDTNGNLAEMTTYSLDLINANGNFPTITPWSLVYNWRQDYLAQVGQQNLQQFRLDAIGFDQLYQRMINSQNVFDIFYNRYTRAPGLNPICNGTCRNNIISDSQICNVFNRQKPIQFG